jgi:hypothetical protein
LYQVSAFLLNPFYLFVVEFVLISVLRKLSFLALYNREGIEMVGLDDAASKLGIAHFVFVIFIFISDFTS